jgi:glycosyltransferase involved in cell wall biosynthesis
MPQNDPLAAPLHVIVLPNRAWKPELLAFRPGEAPDPLRIHRLLAERGIVLEVLDPMPPPYNPWGRGHPLFAGFDPLRALRVLLRRRSAAMVVSVFESGAAVLLLLRRLLWFRPPVLLWDVGAASRWRPRQMTLDFVLPRVDGLLALTGVQQAATARRFAPGQLPLLIGYAVDDMFYHPDFARDGAYVLSVGDDVSRDYPTLVAAMRDVAAQLVLKTRQPLAAGDGTRIVAERLSFLQLRDLYADAAIVVIPLAAHEHPGGITALFEAMAMGKPIIASDVATVREFLTDSETALLVPPGDTAALAAAIAGLLADPGERRRLATNARRHLDRHWSTVAFADRLADAIRAVARRPSRGRVGPQTDSNAA